MIGSLEICNSSVVSIYFLGDFVPESAIRLLVALNGEISTLASTPENLALKRVLRIGSGLPTGTTSDFIMI